MAMFRNRVKTELVEEFLSYVTVKGFAVSCSLKPGFELKLSIVYLIQWWTLYEIVGGGGGGVKYFFRTLKLGIQG